MTTRNQSVELMLFGDNLTAHGGKWGYNASAPPPTPDPDVPGPHGFLGYPGWPYPGAGDFTSGGITEGGKLAALSIYNPDGFQPTADQIVRYDSASGGGTTDDTWSSLTHAAYYNHVVDVPTTGTVGVFDLQALAALIPSGKYWQGFFGFVLHNSSRVASYTRMGAVYDHNIWKISTTTTFTGQDGIVYRLGVVGMQDFSWPGNDIGGAGGVVIHHEFDQALWNSIPPDGTVHYKNPASVFTYNPTYNYGSDTAVGGTLPNIDEICVLNSPIPFSSSYGTFGYTTVPADATASKYIKVVLADATPVSNLQFFYKEFTTASPPPGDSKGDVQLVADIQHGVLTVAWVDHPGDLPHSNGNLLVRCHPAPKANVGSSGTGWLATQTIETGSTGNFANSLSLVKLSTARTMLSYRMGSNGYYRHSDSMGTGLWGARLTAGMPPACAEGGRDELGQAFAIKPNILYHNRDNVGDVWSAQAFFLPTISASSTVGHSMDTPLCGATWTGTAWGILVSDATTHKVYYMETVDGINFRHLNPLATTDTGIDTGGNGKAVSLVCLAHGTLIGLLDSGATVVSFDHGIRWQAGGNVGAGTLNVPPVLVCDGDIVYAVYVDGSNVPSYKVSLNSGRTWG